MVVAGGNKGRSRLLGGGAHLIGNTDHVVPISDHLSSTFGLEEFVEAGTWLDDHVGHDNWFYEDMTYHFSNRDDMVQFKLRYLCDE